MYVDFYGLEREPFHITPDPDFLFLSPCHKEAFATILYGVEQQKGFVVVSGEVGTGKTTILRAYLKQLKRAKIRPLYIFDPDVSFEELLEAILHEFDYGEPDTSQFTRLQWLRHKLIDEYDEGSTVVLMIDEAQNMPVETLEKLRVLTNLETPTDKLMQVLLVGQPELEDKLALHQLRQLNQRVAVRAKLRPLSKKESQGYIRYRINQAGGKPEQIFTDGALSIITRHAKGNPRVLNIVCDNALISGYGAQKRPITATVVRDVVRELSGSPVRWRIRNAAIAAGILFVVGLFAAATWYGLQLDAPGDSGTAVAHARTQDAPDAPVRDEEPQVPPMVPRKEAPVSLVRQQPAPVAPVTPPAVETPVSPAPPPRVPPVETVAATPPTPAPEEAPPVETVAATPPTPAPEEAPPVETVAATPSPPAPEETPPVETVAATPPTPAPKETPPVAEVATAPPVSERPAEKAVADTAPNSTEADKLASELAQVARAATAPGPVALPTEPDPVSEPAPAETVTTPEQEAPATPAQPEAPAATLVTVAMASPKPSEPRGTGTVALSEPSVVPPPPTPAELARKEPGDEVIAPGRVEVSPGDNLTQLVTKVYGFCTPQLIAAVKARNPQIVQPDVIYYGDALVFPPLEELLQAVPETTPDQPE